MSYTLTNTTLIVRDSDGAYIPNDLGNNDYQIYLKWLDEGNTPNPYVEPEPPTPKQKLEAAGLTVDELKSLLGIK